MVIANNGRVVVHLVHGTFARNAAWTQAGSFLRERIEDSFPRAKLSFSQFSWTGANCHRQRLNAAIQFCRHLTGALEESPGASHFVIAHSHGGMVALQALGVEALAQRIAGVVCLATPYLHCRPRDLSFWIGIFSIVAPLLCSIAWSIFFAFILFLLAQIWSAVPLNDVARVVGILVAIVGFLFATIRGNIAVWRGLREKLVDAVSDRIWRLQNEAMGRFCLPEEVLVPLLSIKMVGDEAELFLRVVRFLAYLPLKFATVIGKALVWLRTPSEWI